VGQIRSERHRKAIGYLLGRDDLPLVRMTRTSTTLSDCGPLFKYLLRVCFLYVRSGALSGHVARGGPFPGLKPGLKPWAESRSPFGAINRPKSALTQRHAHYSVYHAMGSAGATRRGKRRVLERVTACSRAICYRGRVGFSRRRSSVTLDGVSLCRYETLH
jgi:hypothetical protein